MVLVDTSIWIDHLNSGNEKLTALLNDGEAAIHPFVIGELACGNLKNRQEIISLLHALPRIKKAEDDEVLFFIEKHKLHGLGIGLIDIHLLASCKLGNVKLFTKDRRLNAAAEELKLKHR
ncbi:type II toxin-antitoxin system VapC family toxin [Pontiella agarivorans]|uniref:PIN domain-containing protein n=1 Tax=Pontiella agarivorans TaxID=3038953 RepID=A0ABU5MTD1_9BACT|nr:PIN domain-containing protein [Pontiella agarivorans]MDZ8117407.1 PIN domain-containing protein [Pontiella agarivorans]